MKSHVCLVVSSVLLLPLSGCRDFKSKCDEAQIAAYENTKAQVELVCTFHNEGSADLDFWSQNLELKILEPIADKTPLPNEDQVFLNPTTKQLVFPETALTKEGKFEFHYQILVNGVPSDPATVEVKIANRSTQVIGEILNLVPGSTSVTVNSSEQVCSGQRCQVVVSNQSITRINLLCGTEDKDCTWDCGAEGSATEYIEFTPTSDFTCTRKGAPVTLGVSVNGLGSIGVMKKVDGVFSQNPGDCAATPCQLERYDEVQLTPVADEGWDFRGWAGDCAGEATVATLPVDADKSCTAEFAQNTSMDTLTVELLNTDGMNIELFAEDNTPLTQQGSEYSASVPHMTAVPLAVRTVGDVTIDFSVVWECGNTLSTTGHNVSIPVNGPTNCTATIEREDPCAGTPTVIVPAVLVGQVGSNIDSSTSSPDTPSYPVATDFGVELTSVSSGGHGPLQVRWVLPAGPVFGTTYVWPNTSLDSGTHQVILEVTDACAQTESLTFNLVAR